MALSVNLHGWGEEPSHCRASRARRDAHVLLCSRCPILVVDLLGICQKSFVRQSTFRRGDGWMMEKKCFLDWCFER